MNHQGGKPQGDTARRRNGESGSLEPLFLQSSHGRDALPIPPRRPTGCQRHHAAYHPPIAPDLGGLVRSTQVQRVSHCEDLPWKSLPSFRKKSRTTNYPEVIFYFGKRIKLSGIFNNPHYISANVGHAPMRRALQRQKHSEPLRNSSILPRIR